MHRTTQLVILSLSLAMLAGCSVQKRTLMPGYHVEWGWGQNDPSLPHASPDELAQLEWAMAGALPDELPDAELIRSPYGELYRVQVSKTEPILPKQINNPTPAVALADPTPWAETYEEQKRFENIAWAAIGLATLLGALGAPEALLTVMGFIGYACFALSRRKRREVLEIKEINGYDTTLERERIKRENERMAVGTVLYAILGIIVIGILISLGEGLFEFLAF